MTHRNYISILAAAAAILSTPALAADPVINFAIQTNQFNHPTMEFKFEGGKYVWDRKAINTAFTANADTGHINRLWSGRLYIDSLGVGSTASFTGNMPTGVRRWTQQGPITFPISFLSVYQSNLAELCERVGGSQPVVRNGLSISFRVSQAMVQRVGPGFEPAPNSIDEAGRARGAGNYANRTVTMPVTVVCGAKPARTQPRPGGVAFDHGPMRVQSVDLRFMTYSHAITRPSPGVECRRGRMSVTIKANQAGAVQFRLWTKVGAANSQSRVVNAWATHDGKGSYIASYQQWFDVERTTSIQAMAEEMVNPIATSTSWKSITLQCNGVGGGGLAGTQQRPNTPSHPRPTVPGPTNKSQGANPTHGPAQPAAVPNIKTAPVAQPPQRATRHIGKGLPRAQ